MKTWVTMTMAATLLLSACREAETKREGEPPSVAAATATARMETTPDVVELSGSLQARQRADVAAQITGRVVYIAVREGDAVRRGQTLARLEAGDAQAAAARAQAMLAQSREELQAAESESRLAATTAQRYETLYQRRSVSALEHDQAQARMQGAEARRRAAAAGAQAAAQALAQARSVSSYAILRAPFDGVVTRRGVDVGGMAVAGMPLFSVDQAGPLEASVALDQSLYAAVRVGDVEQVCVEGQAACMQGVVREVNPAADASSRSFAIRISLPESRQLRSGLIARTRIRKGERRALLLPSAAVVTRGAMKAVFVVNGEGRAALRYVTLGEEHEGRVEALSGLAEGERYVTQPPSNLTEGARVSAPGAAQ